MYLIRFTTGTAIKPRARVFSKPRSVMRYYRFASLSSSVETGIKSPHYTSEYTFDNFGTGKTKVRKEQQKSLRVSSETQSNKKAGYNS